MDSHSEENTAKRSAERGERLPRAHSTCPHDCPSTCALEVEIQDAQTIGRVYGAKDNSYTQGVICAKVARYAERVHHPQRLQQPLRRKPGFPKRLGNAPMAYDDILSDRSAFEPISWDEALHSISDRFNDIIKTDGAEAIWPYHYAGTMGLVQRDSIERMRNLLGSSRQHSTFCVTLADAGYNVGVGVKRGADARLMKHSDLIVVWGGNPVSTQVNVMHHVAKARRDNGAKFIVIDPYLTGTAAKADQHLMLRPGTDGALACAVAHVLLAEGLADRDYLARYTDFDDQVEQHYQTKTPEWAADITGLAADEIVQFARAFGASKKSFIRLGYGFSRSRNGAPNMHAATCLPAITGAWQEPGGGALYGQGALYTIDTTLNQASDCPVDSRVLDQSRIGQILCNNRDDLAGGPPVKALFIQNTNPVVVAPESRSVYKGLQRDDLFTVVHEQFMTETAQMADIVLPATTFLEHDDMYQASGHTYFQVTRALIEPLAECRSNHSVISDLLKRLGCASAADDLCERELMDQMLARSNMPDSESLYEQHWHDVSLPFDKANFLDGFATPDGKFHFKPDWSRVGDNWQGLPTLPDHWESIDMPTAEKPFRLVAAPARQFLNTSFTETPSARKMEKQPTLKIHPADCEHLALAQGDLVSVGNEQGEVMLQVEFFDGVQAGTVVCESLWPNCAFGDSTQGDQNNVSGFLDDDEVLLGINTLTSAEPGKPNGGAVFHDTAVRLRKIATC